MSYEQFKKDLKATSNSWDQDVMEDLDHAWRTDEKLLDKAYAALYHLERVANFLRQDIANYRKRMTSKS